MKARLLVKTKIGQFEAQPFDGVNRSGIRPLGEEVLVLPDKHVEKIGSIFITNDIRETHSLAAKTGTIVAVGEDAWTYNRARTKPFTGRRPRPGDRVVFDRYAGVRQEGLDEVEYVLMSDISIGGMFESNEESKANG